jgi:hypothetical protein
VSEQTPTLNRDRLSGVIALILLALALIPLLNTPGRSVGASVLGSKLDIEITAAGLVTLLAAALTCAGVDMLIHTHPRARSNQAGPTFVFWILPALAVIAAAQGLARASTGRDWAIQLLAAGVMLWIIVRAEFATVDPDAPRAGQWRLLLNVLAYALAFGLFAVIWETRIRSLITASLMAITAFLLSIDLMWSTRAAPRRVLLNGAVVAVILGECAWALNYWRANTITAGLALVLIFYALSGAAVQHLLSKLTRRVLAEFGVVVLAAIALLLFNSAR